jgi:hypothetical protein
MPVYNASDWCFIAGKCTLIDAVIQYIRALNQVITISAARVQIKESKARMIRMNE